MNDEFQKNTLETPLVEEVRQVKEDDNAASLTENKESLTTEDENTRHWIDEIFTSEQERLNKLGISDARKWVECMASIDKALSEQPEATLSYLARVYGVCLTKGDAVKSHIPSEIIICLQNLEQNQKQLWQALQASTDKTKQLTISNFANAKDDDGKLMHPYYSLVHDEMFALLESGVAADFESAYEKALWINEQTRAIMLEKQEAENLQSLAEEADKAKSAGFSPKGGVEKEDVSRLTTREILERTFKELEG